MDLAMFSTTSYKYYGGVEYTHEWQYVSLRCNKRKREEDIQNIVWSTK